MTTNSVPYTFRDETRDTTVSITDATPPLFRPLSIGRVTLRNRIMQAPLARDPANAGRITDWHYAHLGKFALGGVGLVCLESGVGLADEAQGAALAKLVHYLQALGARVAIEVEGASDVLARRAEAAGVDFLLAGGALVGAAEVRIATLQDATPEQAQALVAEGKADLVAIGRELLWNPYWAAQAARKLGADPDFRTMPTQYGWWLDRRVKTGYEKEL